MLTLPNLDSAWIQATCNQVAQLRTLRTTHWDDAAGRAFAEDHLATLGASLKAYSQDLADLDSDLRALAARCQRPQTMEGHR